MRVVVATAILVGLAFHADSPTATERAVVRWFDTLPKAAETFFLVFYDLLALWAVLLLVATVFFVRRLRLARDLLIAGVLAWLLGRILAFVWGRTSLGKAFELVFDVAQAPRFPTVRVAIAVAMVIVASPHLTRPVRRIGQVLVALIALSAMYLGRAYPTDLLGAVVLGWGVAAAVHLAFGTPDRRPTVAQVHAALAASGPRGDRPAPHRRINPSGGPCSSVMRRTAACGSPRSVATRPTRSSCRGRGGTSPIATWRPRCSRPAVSRSSTRPTSSCLARDAGVSAPRVLRRRDDARRRAPRRGDPVGRPLADLAPSEVTDAMLRRIWQQVALLHAARVGHGALDADHVVIGARNQPVIVGFDAASTSVGPRQIARDVAQLLGATATFVEPERAVPRGAAGRR